MNRGPFLVGAAGLAASGLMGMHAQTTQDDDALDRLRRGDIGATPLSRLPNGADAEPVIRWTSDTVRLVRAGANANRIGRMHGTPDRRADLYAVEVLQQPYRLLIACRGDAFTDIAAARSFSFLPPTLPRGSANPLVDAFQDQMERAHPSVMHGLPWSGVAMSAIELAVKAAWPEHDTRIGASSGSQLGGPSSYATKSTKADWIRLGGVRQAEVLDALGAAVTRVYGLTRPDLDPEGPQPEVIVGIEEADPQVSDVRIEQRLTPGSYLAQRSVKMRGWFSERVMS